MARECRLAKRRAHLQRCGRAHRVRVRGSLGDRRRHRQERPNRMFITFEGTEGCGKSTQVGLLAARLRAEGGRVRELREPGGTALGEEIRHTLKHSAAGTGMMPEAELLLMNAARAQLVREVIRPALAAGEIVVCDRFYDSTTAYQGWGRGLDLDIVRSVIGIAVGPTRPDLTILLQVPGSVGAERRRRRSGDAGPAEDRFEAEGEGFFQRVEQGFRDLAEREPGRVCVVDATPGIPEVAAAVWAKVEARRGRIAPAGPGPR
jgi:dTMP kinase